MWKRKETIKGTLDSGNDDSRRLSERPWPDFLLLGMRDKA